MMLRLPRGFVLLALAVFLLMIVLAYWVGYHKRDTELAEQGVPRNAGSNPQASIPLIPPPLPPLGNSPGSPPGGAARSNVPRPSLSSPDTGSRAATGTPVPAAPGMRDLRQIGLNYYELNVASEVDARDFCNYLWQEGVEAQAIKVHNGQSFRVIALQGFPANQLGSEPCKQLGRQIQQLARLYNTQVGRQAVPLAAPYLVKYSGGAAEKVFTRERSP